jgi:hypothetical protein
VVQGRNEQANKQMKNNNMHRKPQRRQAGKQSHTPVVAGVWLYEVQIFLIAMNAQRGQQLLLSLHDF